MHPQEMLDITHEGGSDMTVIALRGSGFGKGFA